MNYQINQEISVQYDIATHKPDGLNVLTVVLNDIDNVSHVLKIQRSSNLVDVFKNIIIVKFKQLTEKSVLIEINGKEIEIKKEKIVQ